MQEGRLVYHLGRHPQPWAGHMVGAQITRDLALTVLHFWGLYPSLPSCFVPKDTRETSPNHPAGSVPSKDWMEGPS